MSYQIFKEDVLYYQRFLKSNGFYKDKLDGRWGKNTDAADQAFFEASQSIAGQLGKFDRTSETYITTLAPKAQILARKFLDTVLTSGLDIRIISGTRTYAQQDALFRKGRYGNKEKVVTQARGGQSNHNFGLAWDIGLFENGKYITADTKYKTLAASPLAALPELEWGGNWVKFKDYPHYQHKCTSGSIAAIRGLFEAGKIYV